MQAAAWILLRSSNVFLSCAPGVTRTPDPRIRNPLLYPAELRAHLLGHQYRKVGEMNGLSIRDS